jgi:hypothetical protein
MENGTDASKTEHDPSAWLFVDNRYWIQAEAQTSKELWNVVRLVPRDSGKGYVGVWDWAKEVSGKCASVEVWRLIRLCNGGLYRTWKKGLGSGLIPS